MGRSISVGGSLTPNTKTTVFTVPKGTQVHWPLLFLTNHTGSNKWVSAWWYDYKNNTEVRILDAVNVDAKKYIEFGGSGKYTVLEQYDEIRLQSETGSDFCYIVTLEYNNKIGVNGV